MDATEAVKALLAAWEKPGGLLESLDTHFTADCVYGVVGASASNGPEATRTFMLDFAKMYPFDTIDVDVRNIAANDDVVLTERVDRFRDSGGKGLISIPLLGLYKVRDGKICESRNHFDTFPFRSW